MTPATLNDVKTKLREVGVVADIFENDDISLKRIIVPKEMRGTGIGSLAMNYLVDYADLKGKRIVLTPSKDFGASSVARLKAFYKRFGFVENKGRHRDFTTRETMFRPAKGAR